MSRNNAIDDLIEIEYHSDRLEGEADRLLTVQEVCELLNVCRSYIYWLTHQKKIPHIKLQGLLRFRRRELQIWLAGQEVRSVGSET